MVLGGRIRGLGNERQVEQYASEKKRDEKQACQGWELRDKIRGAVMKMEEMYQ